MGAILAAGLPAGAAATSGGGSGAGGDPATIAAAIHPVFILGVPLMAVTLALVATIPERPLRRAVRDDVDALASAT
jgi:hypothetical protein